MVCFSKHFIFILYKHWAVPLSLATTNGISVDVFSSRYLDVSVPWVRFKSPILFRDRYFTMIKPNI